ncbi:hypothetical protein MR532_06240 [bacterium]|nr:hypothetical protein [bacterium]
MTPAQETLLSLIRAIVRGAQGVPLALDDSGIKAMDICWAKVLEEATRQGVQGLCFDALELLPAEQRPDKAMLMQHCTPLTILDDKRLGAMI